MNILVGINESISKDLDSIQDLIDRGADEFYCGYLPPEWVKKYGLHLSPNRRYGSKIHQIQDIKTIAKLSGMLHDHKKKLFAAFNEHYYLPEQYLEIIKYIKKLAEIGVDGFIITDPALILQIQKEKLPINIHISGEAVGINKAAVDFFISLGAKRIILPRQLKTAEIIEIATAFKERNIEFEVFMMGDPCIYSGGYCFNEHGFYNHSFCESCFYRTLEKNTDFEDVTSYSAQAQIKKSDALFYTQAELVHPRIGKCALCEIPKLKKAGIHTLKIAGRNKDIEELYEKVALVKTVIDQEKADSTFCQDLINDKVRCESEIACFLR